MSALTDFYRKAQSDPALKAELQAARQALGEKPSKDAVASAVIKVAGKHGVTLSPADFDVKPGSLDDQELKAVAGGCVAGCYGLGYGPVV